MLHVLLNKTVLLVAIGLLALVQVLQTQKLTDDPNEISNASIFNYDNRKRFSGIHQLSSIEKRNDDKGDAFLSKLKSLLNQNKMSSARNYSSSASSLFNTDDLDFLKESEINKKINELGIDSSAKAAAAAAVKAKTPTWRAPSFRSEREPKSDNLDELGLKASGNSEPGEVQFSKAPPKRKRVKSKFTPRRNGYSATPNRSDEGDTNEESQPNYENDEPAFSNEDQPIEEEPVEQTSDKLSSRQLNQIYKFLKRKQKKKSQSLEDETFNNEYETPEATDEESSRDGIDFLKMTQLLNSPNNDLKLEIKEMASNAANRALMHLFKTSPFRLRNVHFFERYFGIYYRYYIKYFERLLLKYGHHVLHDYPFSELNFHHHQDHEHLIHHDDLIELIKTNIKNHLDSLDGYSGASTKANYKKFIRKLLNHGAIDRFELRENELSSAYGPDRHHHHHHHHHIHHLDYPFDHHYDHHLAFDPVSLTRRKHLNFYLRHHLVPPFSLIEAYTNSHNHHLKDHIYDNHFHDHQHHFYDYYHRHDDFDFPKPAPYSYKYVYHRYNSIHPGTNRHRHHHVHHFHHHHHHVNPFLAPDVSRYQLSAKPSDLVIHHTPIVCTNYPEHSAEGFKSFISVESCMQPSYLTSTGLPVFGYGCTFKYICELGYKPLQSLDPSIRCENGFWNAKAICTRDS